MTADEAVKLLQHDVIKYHAGEYNGETDLIVRLCNSFLSPNFPEEKVCESFKRFAWSWLIRLSYAIDERASWPDEGMYHFGDDWVRTVMREAQDCMGYRLPTELKERVVEHYCTVYDRGDGKDESAGSTAREFEREFIKLGINPLDAVDEVIEWADIH
jgi:hypothetical protein